MRSPNTRIVAILAVLAALFAVFAWRRTPEILGAGVPREEASEHTTSRSTATRARPSATRDPADVLDDATFTDEGAHVPIPGSSARVRVGMTSVGRSGTRTALTPTSPRTNGDVAEYDHGVVREWFRDEARGLEHGAMIATRPEGEGVLEVGVHFEGLTPVLVGDLVELHDAAHERVLVYRDLVVTDARGARLSSAMAVVRGDVVLRVDDTTARYPVEIDPLVTTPTVRRTASTPIATGELGGTPFETSGGPSVAIDGDYAVVASAEDGVAGGVYVFVKSGGSWTEQQKLTIPPAIGATARFGYSVGISGDRVIVGAPFTTTGAAAIFQRVGTVWSVEQVLGSTGALADEQFGCAVAISGARAVVGARYDDRVAAGGAAYVFERAGTWAQTARLQGTGVVFNADFGSQVAIDGGTIVIGAIFGPDPATPTGAAFVFTGGGSTWAQQTLLASDATSLDQFSRSIAIRGNRIVIGAPQNEVTLFNQGAAYVFTRPNAGAAFTQASRELASDAAFDDQHGYSVALASNDVLAIGSRFDDAATTDAGSVYLSRFNGVAWTEKQEITGTPAAASDRFGDSVAISATDLVVGAPLSDAALTDAGAVYFLGVTATKTQGEACGSGSECANGLCVDGVCCNAACGGNNAADCTACSVAAGAAINGTCAPRATASTCGNAAAGACDAQDTCNAVGVCVDNKRGSGSTCGNGPIAGQACDAQDVCDGVSNACPNTVLSLGATCRAGSGDVCDPTETCDGSSPLCPSDTVAGSGTPCGSADATACNAPDSCDGSGTCVARVKGAGVTCGNAANPALGCDAQDVCDGATVTCANAVIPGGIECRGAANVCDVAESCTGLSPSCPADTFAGPGTACGSASAVDCDAADSCDGSGTCVARVKGAGDECRPGNGTCDPAEVCDGATTGCPADAFALVDTACGDASSDACNAPDACDGAGACVEHVKTAGASCGNAADPLLGCDLSDTCDGVAKTCADAVRGAGVECRGAASACDVAETCTGTLSACPADAFAAEGVACGSADDTACDAPDACDGDGVCVDEVKATGTVCAAADPLALCDLDDACDGSAKVCPTMVETAGVVCRADAGECDVEETCDGGDAACPADVFVAIDTPCGTTADPTQVCDADDACDGAGACTDRVLAAGTACGDAADPASACDADDACDGAAKGCPDTVLAAGVTCRDAVGPCDAPESCDGVSDTCAADALQPSTFACRPSLGACDPEETCAGTTDCPTDVLTADGTTCGEGLMCSTAGVCAAGTCANTVEEDCDDADPCTVDSCAEPSGCNHTPSSAPECIEDAGTDGGTDAGTDDDAGTDAGLPTGSVSGGCGCETTGHAGSHSAWLAIAFFAMVARRRVRRS